MALMGIMAALIDRNEHLLVTGCNKSQLTAVIYQTHHKKRRRAKPCNGFYKKSSGGFVQDLL